MNKLSLLKLALISIITIGHANAQPGQWIYPPMEPMQNTPSEQRTTQNNNYNKNTQLPVRPFMNQQGSTPPTSNYRSQTMYPQQAPVMPPQAYGYNRPQYPVNNRPMTAYPAPPVNSRPMTAYPTQPYNRPMTAYPVQPAYRPAYPNNNRYPAYRQPPPYYYGNRNNRRSGMFNKGPFDKGPFNNGPFNFWESDDGEHFGFFDMMPKEELGDLWDDMLAGPTDDGDIPGPMDWPSIKMPDPIDVGEQVEDVTYEIPSFFKDGSFGYSDDDGGSAPARNDDYDDD